MPEKLESVLFTDPQAQIPAGYCPLCGGALYAPGLYCIRCGREES